MSAAPNLMPGRGLALSSNFTGHTLTPLGSVWPRHPWQVTPRWNAHEQCWVAEIQPGFVNGKCPVINTTTKKQRELQQRPTFGINPLTRQPYFSDTAFKQEASGSGPTAEIALPLYARPLLPLSWHAPGAIPAYFAERGAFEPQAAGITADGEIIAAQTPPEGYRLLRACDVWIHQPRLGLTSDIALLPGLVTGSSFVTQTLSVRGAFTNDALRMIAGKYALPPEINPLAGVYEEPTWDELVVATVFALSPPNPDSQAEVDGTWQVSVAQAEGVFWDLQYVTPWFKQLGGDPFVPILPPLAGGVAQLIINFFTATTADLLRDALNIITAHSLAGSFYVPTGGGHSIKMPPAPMKPGGINGADRAGRKAAEAKAARQAARNARLNPAWPYGALPIATSTFTQTT